MTPRAAVVVAELRELCRTAAASGDLPDLLAELERVRAEALLSAVAPGKEAQTLATPAAPPKLLTPEQVAKRCGRSRWWAYRNKAILPVTRFPRGGWGVDAAKLERWLESRTGG